MANRDHAEILLRGVEAWNEWRRANPEVRPDLGGTWEAQQNEWFTYGLDWRAVPDLEGADLSSANIRGGWLSGKRLDFANLRKANLRGATLQKASLVETDLSGANLIGVDLTDARLSGAKFVGASLRRACLQGAFADSSNLGARTDFTGVSLRGACLNSCNFYDVDLRHARLTGADLLGAQFGRVDLRYSRLCGALLGGAHFHRSDLRNADVTGAQLGQTVFSDSALADLRGSDSSQHFGPSILDYATLSRSPSLDLSFLRGCGLPEHFIEEIPRLFWAQSPKYHSCFISYSHADKRFATRLYKDLQERGVRCWLDERAMKPGDDIYQAVHRGLRDSEKVLLCCSRSSLSHSWWVDNEIRIALAKERRAFQEGEENFRAIVPLDLDAFLFTKDWTSGYREQILSRLAADFTNWDSDDMKFVSALDRVLAALRASSS